MRDLDKEQITGVVTAAGRVRVTQSDGSRRHLHLARATDPLRRPIPALWWDLEDVWFIGVLVVSRVRRLIARNREWRVEVAPSLGERPTCLAVGRDRIHAAELAANYIVDSGAQLDRDPW